MYAEFIYEEIEPRHKGKYTYTIEAILYDDGDPIRMTIPRAIKDFDHEQKSKTRELEIDYEKVKDLKILYVSNYQTANGCEVMTLFSCMRVHRYRKRSFLKGFEKIEGNSFFQDLRWGPPILTIHDGTIIRATGYLQVDGGVNINPVTIPPEWYTDEGLWRHTQYAYLGRELYVNH